ncbi:LacI family transcriptional regulator [Neorhizobium galegae]|uniref:LacI family DNA-binding transcriptional regulator n=1 Tax=Neorhizobium galegae TaxID=399 RepID=UPI001AEB40D0|nr:LacI family DNA-binding transcriptional regulator [Neorhizobium galegae]MBP2551506.1 LacI family transcriptional regulator [Neorhizobium galegae]
MVTIKEIAKAAAVSPATVSRVLNYDPTLSISPAKRQAVIETAEALNYATPRNRNRAQAGPLQLPNRVLAIPRLAIVHFLEPSEELIDPYYIGVRLGIENRCREYRIEAVKVFHSEAVTAGALLQSVSGAIVVGKHSRQEIAWLFEHARHLVFADFVPRREDLDYVCSDLGLATRKILDGLASAGYQRIAFIGAHDPVSADGGMFGERRCRAYIEWQRERGGFDADLMALSSPDDHRHGQNLRLEVGYEQAKVILARTTRPDALVMANDNLAIGAYRAIQEAGLSIPNDIAVVSYNDIPVAQFLNPPLSTMRILSEAIGETAVDLLVERIQGREYAKHVILPTEMIWRESCRKPII